MKYFFKYKVNCAKIDLFHLKKFKRLYSVSIKMDLLNSNHWHLLLINPQTAIDGETKPT